MKKHLFVLLALVLALTMALAVTALAAGDDEAEAAEIDTEITAEPAEEPAEPEELPEPEEEPAPAGIPVIINDKSVDLGVPATLIDSTTYVPIRAFSMALGAKSVIWSAETASVCINYKDYTIEATCGGNYLVANGRCLYAPTGTFLVNGTFMAPIRVLAKAFGADVYWDAEFGRVYVYSSEDGLMSGKEFYDSDDVYWLSRIINAEARGECMLGKIAVGNVVLNRVNTPGYPNSVYGVVFQSNQFTPASNGSIYMSPSYDSLIAAKLALDGADVIGGALYFAQKNLYCWAYYNRAYCDTIGGHAFYY